jgi:hypothetical protein
VGVAVFVGVDVGISVGVAVFVGVNVGVPVGVKVGVGAGSGSNAVAWKLRRVLLPPRSCNSTKPRTSSVSGKVNLQ